ncbi:MAG: DNA translocase FtsK, partial [Chloroflexota bacterium]
RTHYPIHQLDRDSVFDALPTWGDEIIALLLIIFGILSFLSVFNVAGDASIPQAWATTLRSLFGYGSLIVSGGILALGVILLLPNIGIDIGFSIRRVIALELAFLTTLALMHLATSGSVETRAIARAGEGGGLVGWALSAPPTRLVGSLMVTLVHSFIFVVSVGLVIGVRKKHVKRALDWVRTNFERIGTTLAEQPERNIEARQAEKHRRIAAEQRLARQLIQPEIDLHTPILRIRPNMDNIPPSLRPGAKPIVVESEEELANHPLFAEAVEGETFNIIGEIIEENKKTGEQKVRRPDGRIKRYFSVGEMDEPKRTGRRRKDWPDLDILRDVPLNRPDEDEINTKVVLIENTLLEFDIDIDVVDVRVGPTVTQYALKPFKDDDSEKQQRTRISKIASYQNDLSLALSAKRLRIEAPVPGTKHVGIEVPNNEKSTVALRSTYESKAFYDKLQKAKTPLLIPLGRDVAGDPFAVDLAALPHTLVAGTTGSGKSVALAAIIMALILHNTPDEVRFVMLDPKMVELSRFNGLPHLLGPVETDTERILGVLRWCTREMDDRYRKLEKAGARNISIFNDREAEKGSKGQPLPYIVILIDEVGDLMMSNPDDTEHHLTRLAQMARAVGMHMVVATQRPSVDVLTGLIKANFPGRVAFSVASGVDSRVILDATGAEALLGSGDMLFLSSDASGPKRLQGCFVSDDEVREMVRYWERWAQAKREEGKLEQKSRNAPWEKTLTKLELLSETDDLLEDALEAVVLAREASTAMLQKHLNIGFPRASRIMDLLFELGAIGPPEGGGKMRKVLISSTRKDPMAELAKRHQAQEKASPTPFVETAPAEPKDVVIKKPTLAEFADEDPLDDDEDSPSE